MYVCNVFNIAWPLLFVNNFEGHMLSQADCIDAAICELIEFFLLVKKL